MSFKVDYFTLDSTAISNMYVTLTGTPQNTNVALDIISGTTQFDSTSFTVPPDFRVLGATIRWDSPAYTLYGMFVAGDKIRVIYDKS